MKICSVEDCNNTEKLVKSWCSKHYQRWRNYGDPLFTKKREDNLSDEKLLIWMTSAPQIKKNLETGCWEWMKNRNRKGYGQTAYGVKKVLVHRLHWKLIHKYWPTDILLHSCDNPPCINPDHLREGSHKDNTNDMIKRGRTAVGENVNTAKLTNKKVLKIRKLWKTGKYTKYSLAERFGVSIINISCIIRRKTWTHI